MFGEEQKKDILKLVREKNARRVLIQAPEGLKPGVQNLADFLGKNGVESLISIEPCFGACDLRDHEARRLGCEMLLHIGHADLGIKTELPVAYYEYPIDYDFIPLLRMTIRQIKHRKICLVSTIQFRMSVIKAKKFLEKNGFTVYDGGHVLGCDVSGAKKYERMIECYLFIGSGRFHPLGLQERTGKPVLFLDIEKRSLEDLSEEKDKLEIRRKLMIEKARDLENFGIMVSTKPGQTGVENAIAIKRKLEKSGKRTCILSGDYFSPDKLLGMKIDVLINTACPRIREDAEQFGKIILNAQDMDEMLAEG